MWAQGRWSILRFWTKAEHPSAPSCPAEHSLVRLTQEGCGTVKARAGFSQTPGECPDGWVILLCCWDREENSVTEESGITRETWKTEKLGKATAGTPAMNWVTQTWPEAKEATAGRKNWSMAIPPGFLIKTLWYLRTLWSFAFFFLSFLSAALEF